MKKLSEYVLKEDLSTNPLHSVKKIESAYNQPTTELVRSITVAIESESDAIRVYQDMLELARHSEQWLEKPATEVIADILNEERKHIAQLYKLLKWADVPGQEHYLAGEEEGEKQINLEPDNDKV